MWFNISKLLLIPNFDLHSLRATRAELQFSKKTNNLETMLTLHHTQEGVANKQTKKNNLEITWKKPGNNLETTWKQH